MPLVTQLTITHSFSLQHHDPRDGVKRELDVMVDDQGSTYLHFTTHTPGEPEYKTLLPLSEVGLDMLFHALHTLQRDLDAFRHENTTKH